MKTLLISVLISICAVGFYSKEIMSGLGMAANAQSGKPITLQNLAGGDGKHDSKQHVMTTAELTELAKKDPDAVRKFLESHEAPEERNGIDKLMNLFAHGKYE